MRPIRQHPGGLGRDSHRHPSRIARRTSTFARLHQYHRERHGTVRRVCRNVKRWQSTSMALRWTAAAMDEASKGFRKLKAHKQLNAAMTAQLVTDALVMAIWRRGKPDALLHHSDRGSQ